MCNVQSACAWTKVAFLCFIHRKTNGIQSFDVHTRRRNCYSVGAVALERQRFEACHYIIDVHVLKETLGIHLLSTTSYLGAALIAAFLCAAGAAMECLVVGRSAYVAL